MTICVSCQTFEFLTVLSVCVFDSKDPIKFLYFFFLLISISVTEKAKVEMPPVTDAVKYRLDAEVSRWLETGPRRQLSPPPSPQRVTGGQCSSP